MSIVKDKIFSRDFSYEMPWFFNNDLALRCELGVGKTNREYLFNAKDRARKIFEILFESGLDALFFHHYIYDNDYSSGKFELLSMKVFINEEMQLLRFCQKMQKTFKHETVKDVCFDRDDENNIDLIRVNRIICYPNCEFSHAKMIKKQIENVKLPQIHYVSYDKECIMSIYDSRGCDVVFFSSEKYRKYYYLLLPYLLEGELNLGLMQKRLDNIDV